MSNHTRPMSHNEDPVPYRLFGNADDVPDSSIYQVRRREREQRRLV